MGEKLKKRLLIKALLYAEGMLEDLFRDDERNFTDEEFRDLYYKINDMNYKLMNEPGVWV